MEEISSRRRIIITRSMTKSARRDVEEGAVDGKSNASSSVTNADTSLPSYPKQVGSKKPKTRNTPFLPEEIIFKILVLLPASVLHDVMRIVCRTWYNIIRDPDFIKAHLRRSSVGLFIRKWHSSFSASFLEMVEDTGKVKKKRGLHLKFSSIYVKCCDGLILHRDREDKTRHYLLNPITKQQVTLPPLPATRVISFLCAMACSPSTLECKVVYTDICSPVFTTYILTVGVDKAWRSMGKEHVNGAAVRYLFQHEPKGIAGFIYWCSSEFSSIVALEVETEIFYNVLVPKECYQGGRFYIYTMSERFLNLAVRGDTKQEWEFWALVDCKSGEWRKLCKIDWNSKASLLRRKGLSWKEDKHDFHRLITPLAALKNGDLVIFYFREPNKTYLAYNFKTGRVFRCWKKPKCSEYEVRFNHVNSLVVLKT